MGSGGDFEGRKRNLPNRGIRNSKWDTQAKTRGLALKHAYFSHGSTDSNAIFDYKTALLDDQDSLLGNNRKKSPIMSPNFLTVLTNSKKTKGNKMSIS